MEDFLLRTDLGVFEKIYLTKWFLLDAMPD